MLQKLLSDQLAENFSFAGQTHGGDVPKKAFKNTKISDLIYQTVNIKFSSNKMTAKQYQLSSENWLAQAKFRRQRRLVFIFLPF